ncbi:MAG TPA: hypothetical protein VMH28_27960 [Candidatus Acidoferrales bacterium]|nr:hypothetical protein [Candidatus Acidoferrales bacterium]
MSSRIELEEIWRTRLKAARQRYVESTEAFTRVTPDSADGLMHRQDSAYSRLQAGERERFARQEYMRVLRIFTDLVVDGKIPEELPCPERESLH